jgi:4-amino-4-deoxy-L-arabinose transferase
VHLSKPPLTYWLLAASMSTLGKNEWAVRLPGAIAFALTLLVLVRLGRYYSPARPWLPALIYASSAFAFFAAQIISTDNLLSSFEALAVLGWIEANHAPPDRRRRWQMLAASALVLAFLTKGPPALLPIIALAIYRWRNRAAFPTPLGTPAMLLAGVALALTWFVLLVVDEPSRLGYFVGHELIDRVASDVHDRNPQWYGPVVAYGPVLLLGALPWNLVWVADALRRRFGRVPRTAPAPRILLWWLLLPLTVFVLSRSRLPMYLLPCFVPAALLLAHRWQHRNVGTAVAWLLPVWMLLLIGLKGWSAEVEYDKDARHFAAELRRLLPHPPAELVFLNEPALYGLRLYMNVQIERVSSEHEGNPAVDGLLDEELSEPAHRRVWVAKCDKNERNQTAMAALGWRMEQVGQVERYCIHRAFPEPSATATPAAQSSAKFAS